MLFGMLSRYRISETNVYKVGISGGLEFLRSCEDFLTVGGGMISRELVGLWVISLAFQYVVYGVTHI